MKLVQLLGVLLGDELTIVIVDKDTGKNIISMNGNGYTALGSELQNREVTNWVVISEKLIKVTVGDPVVTNIPLDPDQLTGSVLTP